MTRQTTFAVKRILFCLKIKDCVFLFCFCFALFLYIKSIVGFPFDVFFGNICGTDKHIFNLSLPAPERKKVSVKGGGQSGLMLPRDSDTTGQDHGVY